MQLPPTEDGHLPLPENLFHDEAPTSKRKYTKRGTSGSSGVKWDADEQIVTGLTRYYMLLGMFTTRMDATGYDGGVLMAMGDTCAQAWLEVGHENERVYQTLKVATFDSPIFNLIFSHLAIFVALGANHGLLPASWPAAFELPVPNPEATRAAQTPMGTAQQPSVSIPPSPLEVPHMAPNAARVDASATGVGMGPIAGIQEVEFKPDLMQIIQEQAEAAALAERAQAEARRQQAQTGIPGYNAADTAPRKNQNPALLQQLMRRM